MKKTKKEKEREKTYLGQPSGRNGIRSRNGRELGIPPNQPGVQRSPAAHVLI
jgi:hypothetical protein